ncbi:MAG TPA: fibronectin type III-like domain-contianing protein, partial [Caulobacteraceae bacterium]|nr:fibronectin type III-like domain-contianing protein [Caulobacteraceae bacterium]
EVAQLYVAPPGRTHRLAGWARVPLKPGETRRVTIAADPRVLASWQAGGWVRAAGDYQVSVSPSARLSGPHATVRLTNAEPSRAHQKP